MCPLVLFLLFSTLASSCLQSPIPSNSYLCKLLLLQIHVFEMQESPFAGIRKHRDQTIPGLKMQEFLFSRNTFSWDKISGIKKHRDRNAQIQEEDITLQGHVSLSH